MLIETHLSLSLGGGGGVGVGIIVSSEKHTQFPVLCMTVSHDLVNHKQWSWYNINSRNGKSVMKLVLLPILRPLTFRCAILERFESLKILC